MLSPVQTLPDQKYKTLSGEMIFSFVYCDCIGSLRTLFFTLYIFNWVFDWYNFCSLHLCN